MTKQDALNYIDSRKNTILNNAKRHFERMQKELADIDDMERFYRRIEDIAEYSKDMQRSLETLTQQEQVLAALD